MQSLTNFSPTSTYERLSSSFLADADNKKISLVTRSISKKMERIQGVIEEFKLTKSETQTLQLISLPDSGDNPALQIQTRKRILEEIHPLSFERVVRKVFQNASADSLLLTAVKQPLDLMLIEKSQEQMVKLDILKKYPQFLIVPEIFSPSQLCLIKNCLRMGKYKQTDQLGLFREYLLNYSRMKVEFASDGHIETSFKRPETYDNELIKNGFELIIRHALQTLIGKLGDLGKSVNNASLRAYAFVIRTELRDKSDQLPNVHWHQDSPSSRGPCDFTMVILLDKHDDPQKGWIGGEFCCSKPVQISRSNYKPSKEIIEITPVYNQAIILKNDTSVHSVKEFYSRNFDTLNYRHVLILNLYIFPFFRR